MDRARLSFESLRCEAQSRENDLYFSIVTIAIEFLHQHPVRHMHARHEEITTSECDLSFSYDAELSP